MAFVVGVAILLAAGVAGFGAALQQKAHAQAGADAVALAIAGGGIDSARQVAAANGVTIVATTQLLRDGAVVHVVVVEFGRFSSTAAAAVVEQELGVE